MSPLRSRYRSVGKLGTKDVPRFPVRQFREDAHFSSDFDGKFVSLTIPTDRDCQNKCRKSIELGKKRRKIVLVPLPRNGVDCYSVGLVSVFVTRQVPFIWRALPSDVQGESMVKLVVRDRETIQEAVRRFRKLVERSGIKKEMRRREYYEKPSETRRRSRLRAERRSRRTRMLAN